MPNSVVLHHFCSNQYNTEGSSCERCPEKIFNVIHGPNFFNPIFVYKKLNFNGYPCCQTVLSCIISAPINTIWKEVPVKVVQERSLTVIHGSNYFEFLLDIYGCKKWYLSC